MPLLEYMQKVRPLVTPFHIAVKAFGTGAFETEDSDIYETRRDFKSYDSAIGGEKEIDKWTKPQSLAGQ